mmetsp:Transcript_11395/g.22357  ORF Transcript_11395/g.22357 Transcript_11395/m.22357 type:complete len:255 (+) Transcript_11395:2-766(+)
MDRTDCLVLTSSLSPSLACPICYDFFTPPVYQCSNGHSLCSDCTERHHICPVCSVNLSSRVRNITLERMMESIEVHCKFPACGKLITLAQRKAHESECELNPTFGCVIRDCGWVGSDICLHLKTMHEIKEFFMESRGSVRGWNSKTWKNADWGYSIWNFEGQLVINRSVSTGEIFYLYAYDIESRRRSLRLKVMSPGSEVSYLVKTTNIRNSRDLGSVLPFHLSIKEAEKHFLEPAEGLEEGYKRLSIKVSLDD